MIGLSFHAQERETDDLLHFLKNYPDTLIQKVIASPGVFEWQCQWSVFKNEQIKTQFIGDFSKYFYPASTVKLPIVLLAMEKLNGLDIPISSYYQVQGEKTWQTFEEDFIDIFVLSGNDSFNRLYDFLGGRDAIQLRCKKLGLEGTIQHRLSVSNASLSKVRKTKVKWNHQILKFKYPKNNSIRSLEMNGLNKGIGFVNKNKIEMIPMDFSKKNQVSIPILQEILQRLIYPNYFSKDQQWSITEEQKNKVLQWMTTYPREIGEDPMEYPDNYVKFFLFGETPTIVNNEWQVYNKIGMAYGTLTDNAWIVNTTTKEDFFLTSTILVNQNKIYNDNQYEYESIGIPFLHRLSWAVIEWMQNNPAK